MAIPWLVFPLQKGDLPNAERLRSRRGGPGAQPTSVFVDSCLMVCVGNAYI